ncbi:MAG: ATP-binding protein [Dehalococcoidia bacterium]
MPWPKNLQVDKRIVVLLSASTYESYPKALREAVSNAYDADATRVDIKIDLDQDRMTIVDNGSGMTPDEFDFYLRVAGRQRRRARRSALGRIRIGQFGIGFLSVFPFCQVVQVESTVTNSPVVFRATIPAEQFTTESQTPEDVTAIDVNGYEFSEPDLLRRHYTQITLRGLTYLVRRYLDPPSRAKPADSNTVRSWDGIDRLRWELGETLPVPFTKKSVLGSALGQPANPLAVFLNGKQLFRNDYCEEVLESKRATVGSADFRYAIGTSWKAVHPYEARGLKIRLHGVGVGQRTYFDLQVAGRTFSRLHWLSGTIEIAAGLDESIALDRDSFTTTENYDEVREFFRERLRRMAYDIEAIDVGRRQIHKLAKSKDIPATPKLQQVKEQAAELSDRGFVVRVSDDAEIGSEPATVDLARRMVTIRPKHPSFSESISIAGRSQAVRYSEWDYTVGKYPACRLTKDGTVEINTSYPPFRSSRLGDVLRKVQLILVFAEARAQTKEELFELVQQALLEEFGEDVK